jgi:UDP-galactopyranose mutase
VFFWEEPLFEDDDCFIEVQERENLLRVVVPHLPQGLTDLQVSKMLASMLDQLIADFDIADYLLWYYTPLAMEFTRHLRPEAIIYDCMDELSAFRGAPPGLRAAEAELFAKADLVFTGGPSLYQSKKSKHHSVHCFPSSIDREFFAKARLLATDPADQAPISQPRLGYSGVIDERLDMNLLAGLSDARPDWHVVMIGPVVKVSPSELPQRPNIHYLGPKPYSELPSYLAGWQVGLLPFARNESTRFISPTKTPEYLAAGLPVVSTSIADVVNPYGTMGLVEIADTVEEFVVSVERAIASRSSSNRLEKVDKFIGKMSWDNTWEGMSRLVEAVGTSKPPARTDSTMARGEAAAAD